MVSCGFLQGSAKTFLRKRTYYTGEGIANKNWKSFGPCWNIYLRGVHANERLFTTFWTCNANTLISINLLGVIFWGISFLFFLSFSLSLFFFLESSIHVFLPQCSLQHTMPQRLCYCSPDEAVPGLLERMRYKRWRRLFDYHRCCHLPFQMANHTAPYLWSEANSGV